ncbi:nicotinamide-nucleotide amidohydrolase family protein [Nocardioides sp. S-58]|uniref:Nicotinamide-nucleotide amidohydrolase family protein n=1 Tax=Nocardioides renjunii TaxID=3095075 RepID=A0ABU5KA22_9ACTN|nr:MULTISPECIES: nicotinamide-nucleotide amidohydrolase family protein [unclassified Nocardioides]MDZ5661814.1 nicotinamide-nucleotide amidohydrolase family protein [Nocardioides sp. S-58]WQQ24052.1 nicotinamide-nucleotide amidohydrolase family protein [Nocardioides sp. S-34]
MWSDDALARRVLEQLARRGETVATAESLTGGMLSSWLTDVPGASRSFVGGVVSYATRVKVAVLDVPADVVDRHGVVSEECAIAMARGTRARLDASWGVSTTGVAGPDEQEGKPAGTVWVAVAGLDAVEARKLTLHGDRSTIRRGACEGVLSVLEGLLVR